MNHIDLKGKWQLREAGQNEHIEAQVPGDNYYALFRAGKIADPYYRQNENEVQWVIRKDWIFSREFTLSKDFLAHRSIVFNAESLDTCAEVFINDKLLISTNNMFKACWAEAKNLLKAGTNTISILFKNVKNKAEEEAHKLSFPVPSTYNNSIPHMNTIRKVQCHSGWDWGISLICSGIYGNISLDAINNASIKHIYTEQAHCKSSCQVVACAEIDVVKSGEIEIVFEFNGQKKLYSKQLEAGKQIVKTEFIVNNPKLWWPAGYGKQALYKLKVSSPDQQLKKQIGLRTIEVIREVDSHGTSMKFRVNGIDIFCKGANWIPTDAMPSLQTNDKYKDLLQSAVEANMNMIRIWGGGQYEAEYFYDLCDQYGLLVWQDMMFACSLYPSTPEFISNVKDELDYQLSRLRSHPCIAIWCGDNECIGALNWYEESRKNRDRYLANYDRLSRVREETAEKFSPEHTFWPSSPCAGPGSFADNWTDDSAGDMHYWQVWHSSKPIESYFDVIPRFCSEFGFQSFPSREIFDTFALPEDCNVFSSVMESHQKCAKGNVNIISMFAQYFKMPDGFDNFLYLSQVQQAFAVKTAVEYWRHLRPVCMGTLYWQLNDNWPVASWSSIEYGGKWKQLHYHAKRFYSPCASMAFQKDGKVEVWSVNDKPCEQELSASIKVYDFKGSELKSWQIDDKLESGSSKKILELRLEDLPFAPNEAFMTISSKFSDSEHMNTHFFAPYKQCNLAKANINIESKVEGDVFKLSLTSNAPAFFVNLETIGIKGTFSDNSLTLLPNCEVNLEFVPKQQITLAEFQNSLTCKHLRESYI